MQKLLTKEERRLNEFCREGGLEYYREAIKQIFTDIEKSGCSICSRYEEARSSHEAYLEGCLIRICLKPIYDDPLHIIWTILHEFGHHFSGKNNGPIINNAQKIEREELAWNIGRVKALEFSTLVNQIDNFDSYKEFCLNSYRNQTSIY